MCLQILQQKIYLTFPAVNATYLETVFVVKTKKYHREHNIF